MTFADRIAILERSPLGKFSVRDMHAEGRAPYRYALLRLVARPEEIDAQAWYRLAIDVSGYLTILPYEENVTVDIAISRDLTDEDLRKDQEPC